MWKSFLLYVSFLLETLDIHHGMKKKRRCLERNGCVRESYVSMS